MLGVRASSSLTVSGTNTVVTVGELRFGWSAADATVVPDTAVTMNLNGGTLAVSSITVSGSTANRTHTFNFDGGTLKARGSSAAFFSPTLALTATVKAGGGTIDNNGFDIGIAQNLLTGGGSDGDLAFTGGGTTTLSGTNTFTSDITVENGTLIGAGAVNGGGGVPVLGSRDNTRTITVNSGATLQFNSGNVLGANHVATTAPTLVIHEGGTVTNGGIATNNALNDIQLNGGTLTSTTGHTSSSEPFAPVYGAWNLNGSVTSTGTSTISTSDPSKGWIMLKVPGDKTTDFNVASGTLTVSAPVVDNPTDGNIGSLSKSGAGDMVLSAVTTYSGSTTIKEGTLFLTGTTHATTAITFETGGVLGLDTGVSVTAASAALDLTDGAIQVTGTTGNASYTLLTASSISGAPVLADPVPGYELQVLGNELRLVQTGASSPYEAWAGPGVPFDGDANGDGVANGIAFLIGASGPNANALGKLPKPAEDAGGFVLTFQTLTTTARGTAQLMLEYTTSLATESWTTVSVPGTAGDFIRR
jgi:fibronectin-binding autotransporter adhesin